MNYNIPESKKIAKNAGVTEKFFKFAIGYIQNRGMTWRRVAGA